MSPRRLSDPPVHPELADVSVLSVLHALSDRTRVAIVQELMAAEEMACGTFTVDVAASTLSHHFKVLREAGIIHQREAGRQRLTTLRLDELNARFPGLMQAVMAEFGPESAPRSARREASDATRQRRTAPSTS